MAAACPPAQVRPAPPAPGTNRGAWAAVPRAVVWWCVLVLLTGAGSAAHAQDPDTSRTPPPDTVRVPPPDTLESASPIDTARTDTLGIAPDTARSQVQRRITTPLPFERIAYGYAPLDSLPARTVWADAAHLLGQAHGSFLYDLGPDGWPDGWSLFAYSPQTPELLLDGLPFANKLTERPRLDLLPLGFIEPPRIGFDPLGGPLGVHTSLRAYDQKRPLTEVRYRRNSNGLQAVNAMHVQQREVSWLGPPALLQVLFGYGGRGSDGEYPNTDIRRERQVLGRVVYRRTRWSVELQALHNRRNIGAHSGVVPQLEFFPTVFQQLNAQVLNPSARRRTLTTDLRATLRAPLVPGVRAPLLASVAWAPETFQYAPGQEIRADIDLFRVKTSSLFGRLRQDIRFPGNHLTLEGRVAYERIREENVIFTDTEPRLRLHATAHDSVRVAGTDLILAGGFHADGDRSYPSGLVHLGRSIGGLRLFAEASVSGQELPWVAEYGFQPFLARTFTDAPGAVRSGKAGLALDVGFFDLGATAFTHETDDPLDYYATENLLEAEARVAGVPFQRVGLTGTLGLRRDARRGLYLTAQATTQRLVDPERTPLSRRQDGILPEAYGQVRLGARFVIFRGDLDVDAFVIGRGWTEFRSRQFHAPTGLLIVPLEDQSVQPGSVVPLTFGPDGVVDAHAEITIRGAKLFFSYENALSGTNLQDGVLTVPVYPLPEQQFRFGVFWPILN